MSRLESEARILLSINEAIANILDLNELLQKLADIISEIIGFSRVAIDLSDEAGAITISAVHGYPKELIGRSFALLAFNPQFTKVLNGEVLVYDYDDPVLPEASRKLLEEMNALRVINVPMMRSGNFLGMIVADEPGAKHEFTGDEIRLVSAIAHQAAIAIENARLYQEQREAAEEIRESRRQVLDILESITDGFLALDNDWRITYINRKAAEFCGRRKETLLFRDVWDVFREKEKSVCYKSLRTAKETMEPISFEEFYPSLNKAFAVSAYPYKNGVSVYLSDVTERRKSDEELRESEERYRSLVELSPDGIAVHSEGKFVYVNLAAVKILGTTSADELVGMPVLNIVHPDYRKMVMERINQVRQGTVEKLTEKKYVRLDGTPIDVEVSAAPILYNGKPAIQIVFRDITERKRTEEALCRMSADPKKTGKEPAA